ncbi:MAG: hypothetical protein MJ211_05515 [Bacteroidales bacterium]|nr:hypothetical protein [Bacteroidales bacterium]
MNKEHFLPFVALAIALVGIAFAIASIAVFLSRGKSAYCINKKMKIGACLIMLTSLMSCGNKPNITDDFQETCYEPIETDVFEIVNDTISIAKNDTIKIIIYEPTQKEYIYKITNQENSIIFQNKISLTNSEPNYKNEFDLSFDKKLIPGEYNLILTNSDEDRIFSSQLIIFEN